MTFLSADMLTLEGFMGLIGGEYAEILHTATPLDSPIHAAVIYDSAANPDLNPGDFVLAVGLSTQTAALTTAIEATAQCGGAALACKATSAAERAELMQLAQRFNATLVAIAPEFSWDQVSTIIRTAIATMPDGTRDAHGMGYSDLFALANSAAAMLEGPVVIDDEKLEVIAFSSLGGPIDDLRQQSILHRRPPSEFLQWCETSGTLPRIRQSLRPVRIHPLDGDARLVIAIRAGAEILGYLWVSEKAHPFDQDSEDLLAEIARVAALQILRSRVSEDISRRLRADAFRSLLVGRGDHGVLATRMGLPNDTRCRLVAFKSDDPNAQDDLLHVTIESMVSLHVTVASPRGAVTQCGNVIYVVLPERENTGPDKSSRLAKDIVGRAERQLKVRIRAAVGPAVDKLSDIPQSRRDTDRLFSLPIAGTDPVVIYDDSRALTILAELSEIFSQRPKLLQGGIAALMAIDVERNTDYMETLQTYFDCSGDLTAAAKKLFVHRNTLKYRLSRIHDMCGVNLEDPAERLVAELQARYFVTQCAGRSHKTAPIGESDVTL